MNNKAYWRAYTISTPDDLYNIVETYHSRTGKKPIAARISTRCHNDIFEAVLNTFGDHVEQVPWLFRSNIWLTHKQPKHQSQQLLSFQEEA